MNDCIKPPPSHEYLVRAEAQKLLCCKKTFYFARTADGSLDSAMIAGKRCVTLESVQRFLSDAAAKTTGA